MAESAGLVLAVIVGIFVIGAWAYGMRCYLKIAERAGYGFWKMFFSFQVYSYAFNEMSGSPETRGMSIGFGIVMAAALLGKLLPFLLHK